MLDIRWGYSTPFCTSKNCLRTAAPVARTVWWVGPFIKNHYRSLMFGTEIIPLGVQSLNPFHGKEAGDKQKLQMSQVGSDQICLLMDAWWGTSCLVVNEIFCIPSALYVGMKKIVKSHNLCSHLFGFHLHRGPSQGTVFDFSLWEMYFPHSQ